MANNRHALPKKYLEGIFSLFGRPHQNAYSVLHFMCYSERMKFARFAVLALIIGSLTVAGLYFNAERAEFTANVAPAPERQDQNLAAAGASPSAFDKTFAWVKGAGYAVIFFAMLIEGPVVNAAAAFASALGYFSIWAVILLAILGDLVADFVYYALGYFSRISVIERYGHYFGISERRMKHLERLLNTHPIKTLIVIKLMPVLPTPGLMIVGTTRMPLKEYATMSTLIILPKITIFTVLGYYFGSAYNSVTQYAQNGQYFIIAAIIAVIVVYWAYQKSSELIARQLETV